MNWKINKYVTVRSMTEKDIKSVQKLKLKFEDAVEIEKMIDEHYSEYLAWHTENRLENTNIIEYKGKVFGIIGVSDEGNMFFLTAKLDKMTKFMMGKYFKQLLELVMVEQGKDTVYVFVDREYETATRWATRYGFFPIDEMNLNGYTFTTLAYNRQIVAN